LWGVWAEDRRKTKRQNSGAKILFMRINILALKQDLPNMDKRTFLKNMTLGGLSLRAGLPLAATEATNPEAANPTSEPKPLAERLSPWQTANATDLAANEEFWSEVRSGYKLKPDYINL